MIISHHWATLNATQLQQALNYARRVLVVDVINA